MNLVGDKSLDRINIRMFNKFSIFYKDKNITDFSVKSRKVILLIEYMIVNRFKNTTQERLFDILWEDKSKCDNPANALKNLVYRARTLLEKLFDTDNINFILYKNDTYIWNNEIDCIVDVEEFEKLLIKALDTTIDDEKRIELYLKALSFYTGEFLDKKSSEYWVLAKKTYYASEYIKNVIKAVELNLKNKRYKDIINICEVATEHYPFEEQIQILLIKAYTLAGL